ncbi:hypothetical protein TYRP_009119 [Tyrophagus putrescentiae]|nr:hypothetical protein TYRP_009119 [Tyrophagus putrescentiae]
MKRVLLLCGLTLLLLVNSSTGKVNEKSQQQQGQNFERIEQQSVPIGEVPVSSPADNAAVLSSKNTGATSSWNRGSYSTSGDTMITYNPVKYSVRTSFRNPSSSPTMVQGAVQQVSRTVTYRDVDVPTIRVNRPPMQIEIGGNSGGSLSNPSNQLHILFKSNSGPMFEPFGAGGGPSSVARPEASTYARFGRQQPARRVMTVTNSNPTFDYSQYMRPVQYSTHVIKPMPSSSGRHYNAQQNNRQPFYQGGWQANNLNNNYRQVNSQIKEGIQMQAGQMYEIPTQTRVIRPGGSSSTGGFSTYNTFVSSPTSSYSFSPAKVTTTVQSGKSAFEAAREILGEKMFNDIYGTSNIVTASKPLVLNRQTGGGERRTHFIQPPSAQRYSSSSSSNSYSSYSSSSSSNFGPNAGSSSKTTEVRQSFNSALPPAEQHKQSVVVTEVQVKPAPVHVVQPAPVPVPVAPVVPLVQPVQPVTPVFPQAQPAVVLNSVPLQSAQVYNQRQQEVYSVQPLPQQPQQVQTVQQTFKPFIQQQQQQQQSSRYQQQQRTGSYSSRPVQQQQQQQFFQQSVPLETIPVESQQKQQQQLTAAQPLALAVLQNPVYRIPVETVSTTNVHQQEAQQIVPVFQTTRTVQVRPLVQETHLITPQTPKSGVVEQSSNQFTTSVQQQQQPAPSVTTFEQTVQQQPAQPAPVVPLAPYPQPSVSSTNVQQTIAEPVVFGSKVQTKFVQEDALQQQQQQQTGNSVASSSSSSVGEEEVEAKVEEAVPAVVVAPTPIEVPVVSFTTTTNNNNVDKSDNNRVESSVEYAQEAEGSTGSTGSSQEEPIVEYNKLKERPQPAVPQPQPAPQYKPLPQFVQQSTSSATSSQTSSSAQSEDQQNQIGSSVQTSSVQQQSQPLPYGTRLVQPAKPFDQQQTEQIQQSYLTGNIPPPPLLLAK